MLKKLCALLLTTAILLTCTGCSTVAVRLIENATSGDTLQSTENAVAAKPEQIETAPSADAYEELLPEEKPFDEKALIEEAFTEETPSEEAPAPEAAEPATPEEVLSELYTHMWLLNECMQETYGTSAYRETAYGRVYTSQEAMMSGEPPIDIVPRNEIVEVTDPIDATLYEVIEFRTNAEIRANLEKYIMPDLVDLLFYDNFEEFNGKLYIVYGSQGYGAVYYDIDSAWIMDLGEEYCTVVADLYYFDELSGEVEMVFQKINGAWYLAEYQEIYD